MGLIKAPPDNLGARHRALNAKVQEAVDRNVPFDTVKDQQESSDVDKLCKIDIAAKYKNVDYIIEILKSGDDLYTTRALKKCQWLYQDEYFHIINPKHLEENIFPVISAKMKKKIVKAVAPCVKKPDHAAKFFHYCFKENMTGTALTCFLYTTEEFKLAQLGDYTYSSFESLQDKDFTYLRLLVGKSFKYLEALLDFMSWRRGRTIEAFKNFFYESEDKYLDIAEKYVRAHKKFDSFKFGPKLSDAIMKKHKHRVLAKPQLYVYTVDIEVLVRNSTTDDAKIYAEVLLPEEESEFWSQNQYAKYESIFKIIPHEQTYAFFKNYFTEHYPKGEFEMHPCFYHHAYYKFMTLEQRHDWAYRHLKSEKQMLGVGRDYLWYRFIRFEEAFEEIKRFVGFTKDVDTRCDMVQVLIESARTNRELETLFRYYSKRHMNEGKQTDKHRYRYIQSFLSKVLSYHNVFDLDHAAWSELYALLFSNNLINMNEGYKTIAILWHILHGIDMPQMLIEYLLEKFHVTYIKSHLNNITDPKKQQILHEYFYSFYMYLITESKNKTFGYEDYQRDGKSNMQRYFDNINTSMKMFNEDGEKREKQTIQKLKKIHYIDPNEISNRALLRYLKKDKNLVIDSLQGVRNRLEHCSMNLNTFLKKIKIYFPDDVAKIYLNMFQKMILYERKMTVKTGVYAIFQLANEDVLKDLMKNYCPVEAKIDRNSCGLQFFRVQKAICRYACLSRPHVPLTSMVMYIKGDYIKYCLHLFNTYLTLLPRPICQQFVRLVIDSPVSVQKHAIRMAFRCYDPNSLKEAIVDIWKHTNNVSLRCVIYKAFFKKVVETNDKEFYDILEKLTLDLNQDDDNAIFVLILWCKHEMPTQFRGEYIKAAWETVNKFKDLEPNITRKKDIIILMCDQILLVPEEFATTVVNEHIHTMIVENKLPLTYSKTNIAALYVEKWRFLAHYIIRYPFYEEKPYEKFVEIAQYIVRKIIENWSEKVYETHVYQKCCWDFFKHLKFVCVEEKYADFEDAYPIFEGILNIVDEDLKFYQSYYLRWELQLMLLMATILKSHEDRERFEESLEEEVIAESMQEFGEGVSRLISECVKNNTYCLTLLPQLRNTVKAYAEELLKLIHINIHQQVWGSEKYFHKALLILAGTLSKSDLIESHLLAVHIIPTDVEDPSDDFKGLINIFQGHPNSDIQFYLYKTFEKYCNRI